MLTRSLYGLVISLGLTAAISAQQPTPPDAPQPAAAPVTQPATPPAVPDLRSCPPTDCAPSCPVDLPVCDCLCGPPGRIWASGEVLYWAMSGQRVPPLVTASPAGTPQTAAGVLPGSTVLFGDQRINDGWEIGFRLNVGVWLDPDQRFGVTGDLFFLENSRERFVAGSDGSRIIARPFVNALTGQPDAQLVSFPGVLAGSVAVDSESDFIGGGAFLTCNLCCNPCGRFDLLVGYRYLNLQDDLTIREDLTDPTGNRFLITDRFETDNSFHGVPVGFTAEQRFGRAYASVRGTVALGVSQQTTTIGGSSVINGTAFPGGLLTQPTNIGRYTQDDFAVVPEFGVRVGAQVTSGLRAFVGYDFLYWSNVARAGEQIDLRVNPNQLAPAQALNGPALPAFVPNQGDFWVQGISAGVELRY